MSKLPAAPKRAVAPRTRKIVLTPPDPKVDVRCQADFARRLRNAMAAKNMTASDLAAAVWGRRDAIMDGKPYKVAKNRERISVYVSGRGMPRLEALTKIAQALGTTPAELAPVLAQSRVPPEVTLEVLDGGARAALRVNTVVSSGLAMKIARLIQQEHGMEGVNAAA